MRRIKLKPKQTDTKEKGRRRERERGGETNGEKKNYNKKRNVGANWESNPGPLRNLLLRLLRIPKRRIIPLDHSPNLMSDERAYKLQ